MKKAKRTLSLILCFALVLGAFATGLPGIAVKAKADTWDGTYNQNTGFTNNHITSARGLAYFINRISQGTSFSGQTVYLDVDVNLNNIDFGNSVFPYNDSRYF